ncbi:hypothetical protein EVAR_91973_1 [Eumeta japonica]|uniref:Uncharacterized protein n=1 Tax=Eumeta variegata TaxID=151549 RepID=A0A4C2A3M6_EUMVA|nr:hypothetical protein EVAR_91973_1 [Eumeta japonica]
MTVLTTDRVLLDGKTVLQCWFPRTVELFDEERHRLETWRTGAAYHRSTDRGRENCLRDADNRRKTNDLPSVPFAKDDHQDYRLSIKRWDLLSNFTGEPDTTLQNYID